MMSANENIYVISEGERHEGSTPVALTKTLQDARKYVYDRYHGAVLKQGENRAHWVAPRGTGYDVDLVHVHRLRLGARETGPTLAYKSGRRASD